MGIGNLGSAEADSQRPCRLKIDRRNNTKVMVITIIKRAGPTLTACDWRAQQAAGEMAGKWRSFYFKFF